MIFKRLTLALFTILLATAAQSQTPQLDSTLPLLSIEDRGEINLQGDNVTYSPWSSSSNPGTVHVLQYLAATRSASKVYSAFTDKLGESFTPGDFHVTTIINLDAAMWGTSGLVVSEVEDSKREFPKSTLVLDEDGMGMELWQLEKKGAAITIMDKHGTVLYFTQKPMSDADLDVMMNLVRSQIDS